MSEQNSHEDHKHACSGIEMSGTENDYIDSTGDELLTNLGLSWTLRDYKAESYMFAKHEENSNDLKDKVLLSERVVEAIDELSNKDGTSKKDALQKAKSILDEIAHTFNLKAIRFMAFVLSKIVKRIFKHVYVNKKGITKLSESVKYAPLVLVPSHNSYFDFLLTSLVCFANDLPIPAIASGQDFLNIAVVNRLLRGSGAYFLRRSFATDHFYKSIFTEYMQQLIKNGQMPVEFFLEGTRSRSGKALHPKTGMLSMITELFFLGQVPDVHFCPISISYECIAEEQLYVFELLGIPKPKETLSGLVKARKVLSADYGTVYFHFGDVVSLRDYCSPSINRAEYALFPRSVPKFKNLLHTAKEKKMIHGLAEYLVNCQQTNMVIYPRSVVAAAVLQNIVALDDVKSLIQRVAVLLKELHKPMHEINDASLSDITQRAIELSTPVLKLSEEKKIEMLPVDVSFDELKKSPVGAYLDRANKLTSSISSIYLSLQRNKLMHALLMPSYIAAAARFTEKDTISFRTYCDIYDDVTFLCKIYRPEFLRHADIAISEDIEHGLNVLELLSCVKLHGHGTNRCIQRLGTDDILLKFLQGLIHPFLEGYWLVGQCMTSSSLTLPCSISSLTSQLQLLAASTFHLGILSTCESISLLTLKNGISSLMEAGCLLKPKIAGKEASIESVDRDKLRIVVTKLGRLAGLPDIWLHFAEDGGVHVKSRI